MSYIDPRIHHRGVSALREYDLEKLRAFAATDHLVVFQANDEPLAVLVPYELYQRMQADVRILNEQREMSAALARLGESCGKDSEIEARDRAYRELSRPLKCSTACGFCEMPHVCVLNRICTYAPPVGSATQPSNAKRADSPHRSEAQENK